MKLKEFYKKLEKKDFFKKFTKENQDVYLISVFCIITKNEKESDKIAFNFYSPLKKRFFCSEYPFYEIKELEEREINEKPLALEKLKVDMEDLLEKVNNLSKDKKQTKIIGFLLNKGWKIRVFYNDLSLKKIDLDLNGNIENIEEANLINNINN
ncbi:MAG: hypothetical protein QW103_01165 [Candidatus Pacearchaeota archaeon]